MAKYIAIFVRRSCAGQGSGGIVKKGWECTGDEERLEDCSTAEADPEIRVCDHRTEAGVYCSGTYITKLIIMNKQNGRPVYQN